MRDNGEPVHDPDDDRWPENRAETHYSERDSCFIRRGTTVHWFFATSPLTVPAAAAKNAKTVFPARRWRRQPTGCNKYRKGEGCGGSSIAYAYIGHTAHVPPKNGPTPRDSGEMRDRLSRHHRRTRARVSSGPLRHPFSPPHDTFFFVQT